MENLRLKLVAGLCLWILSVQGISAFTLAAGPESEDSGFNYTQSASPKQFYHEISIFKIEHAPQDEVFLLPFPHLPSSILFLEGVEQITFSDEYTYRDQRYGLKILVFPFHSFW